jgi:hypothetical protein
MAADAANQHVNDATETVPSVAEHYPDTAGPIASNSCATVPFAGSAHVEDDDDLVEVGGFDTEAAGIRGGERPGANRPACTLISPPGGMQVDVVVLVTVDVWRATAFPRTVTPAAPRVSRGRPPSQRG